MIEAFPLHWPLGYKRTSPNSRIRSKFKQGMEASQRFVREEIDRLGGGRLIISSNIPVRKDGGLYTDWMVRKIEDPGVAIYFKVAGEDVSMCCDQYLTVWENIYALGKSIEAIRGLERWGASEFMQRVFSGFKALPEQSAGKPWWEVLGCSKDAAPDIIKTAYRVAALLTHPDKGGNREDFAAVQEAYRQATS